MSRAPSWLLAAGLLVGVAAAVIAVARPAGDVGLGDAVAVVEGRRIPRAEYERALAAVAADRRGAVDPALRRLVLDKLIDEALLVRRGEAMGLVAEDTQVRATLGQAVLDRLRAEAERAAGDVDDAELRRFLAENPERFAGPPRVQVARLVFRGSTARPRAADAQGRIARGESVEAARAATGAEPPAMDDPPAEPIPVARLGDYLGGNAARAAERIAVGTAAVVEGDDGVRLIVVQRREAGTPVFEAVREAVRAERVRVEGERRLRAMLDEARRSARVRIADDVAGAEPPR